MDATRFVAAINKHQDNEEDAENDEKKERKNTQIKQQEKKRKEYWEKREIEIVPTRGICRAVRDASMRSCCHTWLLVVSLIVSRDVGSVRDRFFVDGKEFANPVGR